MKLRWYPKLINYVWGKTFHDKLRWIFLFLRPIEIQTLISRSITCLITYYTFMTNTEVSINNNLSWSNHFYFERSVLATVLDVMIAFCNRSGWAISARWTEVKVLIDVIYFINVSFIDLCECKCFQKRKKYYHRIFF